MPSERVQRQIDSLLDEADAASTRSDWQTVRERASAALAFDPENSDARSYVEAADRAIGLATAQKPVSTEVPTAVAEHAPQPASFANGRYTVKRFLGEGGKKRVYLAHDSLLDRDVAFALIKTEGLDEASRIRITREAQAMGRLGDHPNIVTVYDIGEEAGAPYMVLPVLAGGDVEGVIEKAPEHRMPLERALQIAIETCRGLEFAHGRGIVHRDLKPGNVWLSDDGTAKIGDFGLAVATDRSRLTQAGMMVGTVSYMPPEQAMGGAVGPRSDLYSLGAMLYEMVCGRPPFVGDESVAIIGQHLNTPPVAPTWHRPECPPALETLILRLLEKDPSRRPASATEVREALESVRVGTAAARDPSIAPEAPTGGDNPLYRRTFVGREAEVRQLQAAFDAALSGQGGLVMVVGEPGIGKTALCEQLATYVTLRGGKALVGHCYEEGSLSLPYLAFVEAMRSYVLAREPDGLRSDLGTAATDVARIVSEVRDRVQGVELRPAGDPEDDRWRLLQAITSFLRNSSTVQPLCIVLEDLHWADHGTLDLLQHVARNLQGARLLIVGTYRDVEVDRAHPLSAALGDLRRGANFTRVPLRGLTVDEVHRMYQAIRGQDVPWAQAELVHRQTEGHPLFVQEVLRYLVEEGVVYREGGRYQVREGDQQSEAVIPEGLRDVVGRRLVHLSERTNQVLSLAAVIGREFRLDLLQRVLTLSEEDLYAALEEAQERAVIEQRQAVGTVGFRFTHALFRQTLYEEIFTPRRIRLHQQVGNALEDLYARRLEEHAAEMAEHFAQSTEDIDLEKAIRYCELAAQRAMSVSAYSEAVRHLDQAIRAQEVLDPDDKRRTCDHLLALCEALNFAGQPRRTIDEIAPKALALAEELTDRPRAARTAKLAIDALYAYGAAAVIVTDPAAQRWPEAGLRYSEDGSVERFWALTGSAWAHANDLPAAHQLMKSARLLAYQLDDNLLKWTADTFCLSVLGTYMEEKEREELAVSVLHRSAQGIGQQTLRQAYFYLSASFMMSAQRQEFAASQDLVRSLAEQTKQPNVEIIELSLKALTATIDGRLEEAMAFGAQTTARGEETGLAGYARAMAYSGQTRAAALLGGAGLLAILAGRSDYDLVTPVTALGLAVTGDRRAREPLSKVLSQMVAGDRRGFGSFLDGMVMLGAVDLVEPVYEMFKDLDLKFSNVPGWPCCDKRILGDAAMLLDRPDEAIGHYRRAIADCEAFGFRPEAALAHLGAAEAMLPEESLHSQAIEHLDFAIAELRDMKMQPALERALRHRGLLKA